MSLDIPCAKAAVSHVIGKGGCVIKQLQTDTGTSISVITAEDPPIIRITGTPEQIEAARVKVQAILAEQANPDYTGPQGQRLRDAAAAAASERKKLRSEARAAFKAKDRTAGFATMKAAKIEGEKERQLSQEATIAILRHRNDGKGDGYLDLHGLRAAEALDAVAERIALLESYNSECPTALEVIAGAGHHSANGKATLRPATAEWLKAHKFDFDEISAGTFVVQVPALGRPMPDENKTSRSVAAHPTGPHQTAKATGSGVSANSMGAGLSFVTLERPTSITPDLVTPDLVTDLGQPPPLTSMSIGVPSNASIALDHASEPDVPNEPGARAVSEHLRRQTPRSALFIDIFELTVTFIQLLASTLNIPEFKIPSEWDFMQEWVSYLQMNFTIVREGLPDLDDVRIYFIAICAMVPVGLSLAGMLVLNPLYIMLWYSAVVFGICALAAGGYSKYLQISHGHEFSGDEASLNVVMIAGALTVLACIIMAYVFFKVKLKRAREDEFAADMSLAFEQRMEEDTEFTRDRKMLTLSIVGIVLFIIAALLIATDTLAEEVRSGSGGNFRQGVGYAALVAGIICLIFVPLHFFPKPRKLLWRSGRFILRHFMRVLLTLMAFAYVPVGSGLFLMFNCNDVTCPAGTLFKDFGTSPVGITAGSNSAAQCTTCYVGAAQTCQASRLAMQCATNSTDNRLVADRRVPCGYLKRFFWPASAAIIIVFMIGVPFLFHQLIYVSTKMVMDDNFPISEVDRQRAGDDLEKLYAIKNRRSRNAVQFLHDPYEPTLRYTRLYLTLHKLAVVFATAFIIRVSSSEVLDGNAAMIALSLTTAFHVLLLGWLLWRRPFIFTVEDIVAIVLQITLLIVSVIAILIQAGVTFPGFVLYAVLGLVALLPIIAIVVSGVMTLLEWRSRKSAQEDAAQERMAEPADEEMQEGAPSDRATHDGYTINIEGERPAVRFTMTVEERRRMAKIKRTAELEVLEMKPRQDDADLVINAAVHLRLNIFLMVVGVFGCMALGIVIVGLREEKSLSLYNQYPQQTTENQIAGKSSWSSFTLSCCCSYALPKDGAPLIERWDCGTESQERKRSELYWNGTHNAIRDGFAIRPMCGVAFNNTCNVTVGTRIATTGTTARHITLDCPAPFNTTAGFAATKHLW